MTTTRPFSFSSMGCADCSKAPTEASRSPTPSAPDFTCRSANTPQGPPPPASNPQLPGLHPYMSAERTNPLSLSPLHSPPLPGLRCGRAKRPRKARSAQGVLCVCTVGRCRCTV
jgi:hypothetical protein